MSIGESLLIHIIIAMGRDGVVRWHLLDLTPQGVIAPSTARSMHGTAPSEHVDIITDDAPLAQLHGRDDGDAWHQDHRAFEHARPHRAQACGNAGAPYAARRSLYCIVRSRCAAGKYCITLDDKLPYQKKSQHLRIHAKNEQAESKNATKKPAMPDLRGDEVRGIKRMRLNSKQSDPGLVDENEDASTHKQAEAAKASIKENPTNDTTEVPRKRVYPTLIFGSLCQPII